MDHFRHHALLRKGAAHPSVKSLLNPTLDYPMAERQARQAKVQVQEKADNQAVVVILAEMIFHPQYEYKIHVSTGKGRRLLELCVLY